VRFEFAKVVLTTEARAELGRFAACAAASRMAIRVEGHSDRRGSADYNRWLAWDRAAAVSAYLRERGVPDRRIRTRSAGAASPLCEESTEPCFARNRRVEVFAAQ
jgi:OOP family OmpA-OmpF porin